MPPPPKLSRQQLHRDSDIAEMPSNSLWVGNLSMDVTDADLMNMFAQFGALDSVTSYSSRSYAFIFFKHMEDAQAAKEALQGAFLRGNSIKIEFARPVCFCSDLCVVLGLFGLVCLYNMTGVLLITLFVLEFIGFALHLGPLLFDDATTVEIGVIFIR